MNNLLKTTNRSKEQTEHLLRLCSGNFLLLQWLEWSLYNNSKFHSFVPENKSDVDIVLTTEPKSIRVGWDEWKSKTDNNV